MKTFFIQQVERLLYKIQYSWAVNSNYKSRRRRSHACRVQSI